MQVRKGVSNDNNRTQIINKPKHGGKNGVIPADHFRKSSPVRL